MQSHALVPTLATSSERELDKSVASATHLDFIDGLRGAAVLAVVARHYYVRWCAAETPPRWAAAMGLGYLGVHLFLLLSGFCVAWPYVGTTRRPLDVREFAWKRATRILPAYYVALSIATLAASAHTPWPELIDDVVTHATMTHNFFRSTATTLNAPLWSLALESQLYFFLPLILLGFRRIGMTKSLLMIAVGQAAFRFAVIGYGTDYNETTFVLPWSVAGRLLEFGLGANAAVLLGNNVLAKRPAWNASALFGGALLAFALGTVCKRLLGVSHPVTDLMWTLGFWSLIVSAAFPRGVLRRWMSFAPLAKIGVFSYSVYLVHEFVLGHVMSALASLSHTKAVPLVLAPVAIGLTLIPGYVFYRVVEQPAIDFFRARLQVRLSAPPAR